MGRGTLRAAATLNAALSLSCNGVLSQPFGSQLVQEGVVDDGQAAVRACDLPATPVLAATPRLARLTHRQYANATFDLTGFDVPEAQSFAPDPTFAGFDNNTEQLAVDGRLLRDYQAAAEGLAARLVAPSALTQVVPCAPTAASCARQFIEGLGRKVYRRPLSAIEVDNYLALFVAGAAVYEQGTPFERGVRIVLEAFFQSPNFLYRTELSNVVENVRGRDLVALNDYEIASRLAAALWNSTPDAELLDAAAQNAVHSPEQIRAQAERMVAAPALARTLDDFHRQWLKMHEYGDDPKIPPLPDGAGDAMRAETLAFVRRVAMDLDGTYAQLITAPFSLVNNKLAPLYGLDGTFGTTLAPVNLDPNERGGLLTQLGFLSAHASSTASSPIHRGVFVLRQILCADVQLPNMQIDPTLPPRTGDIVTTRDQVAHHTANPTCQVCHSQINGLGFAFEHYDARGAFRTEDNGAPVDASGEVFINGEQFVFDDATQLAAAIGQGPTGRRCYLEKWYTYAYGRPPSSDELCVLDTLDRELDATGDPKVRAMLVALTTTDAFRYRTPE